MSKTNVNLTFIIKKNETIYLSFIEEIVTTVFLAHAIVEQKKYKKRLLLRCIHHFKSDSINNMDHMGILDT